MGNDDPLYRKLDEIVHRILNDFTDNLELFDELRADLEALPRRRGKGGRGEHPSSSAEEINLRDRAADRRRRWRKAEIESRIEQPPGAELPRRFPAPALARRARSRVYAQDGEDSDAWAQAVATLEDLVWSVQPKKTTEDRKHLVALLPSLLKRMDAGSAAAHRGRRRSAKRSCPTWSRRTRRR